MNNALDNNVMENKGFEVVNLRPDQIFTFPEGIPGFDKIREYCILYREGEKPFAHLSALGGFNLEFIVVNPWLIYPEYKPDVSDDDFISIDSPEDKELMVLAIVALSENIRESTINLAAPVLVNTKTGKARQVVIRNLKDYSANTKLYK
jgi:flagellar assembly factor FliW